MKTFPLRLSDELHKEIENCSHDMRMSKHAYVLFCVETVSRQNMIAMRAEKEHKKAYKSGHAPNCTCLTCKPKKK